MPLATKYDYSFSSSVIDGSRKRLINQLWKLLPLKEENGEWKKQLDNVLIEINGLNEIFRNQLSFLTLLSKLEGLRTVDTFETYRRTVFESINLLGELYHE